MGTWRKQMNAEAIRAALDEGAQLIDTAEAYSDSEKVIGEALKDRPREQVFIASKVSPDRLQHHQVRQSITGSLRRLKTDYIDLYQIHWPNPEVSYEETMGALEDAVDEGLIRFIGVSNFSIDQITAVRATLKNNPLVSVQVRFNLLDRAAEAALLPWCLDNRITMIAYRPTTFRYQRDRRVLESSPVVTAIAGIYGKTPIQIALNWCVSKGVIAIPRSSNPNHVRDNCHASEWQLLPEHKQALEEEFPIWRT